MQRLSWPWHCSAKHKFSARFETGLLVFDEFHPNIGFTSALYSIGCSTLSWLRCAGSLTTCAAECIDNGFDSPQCFHCLGSNYNPCIKCIPSKDMEDIKQLASTQHGRQSSACAGGKHFYMEGSTNTQYNNNTKNSKIYSNVPSSSSAFHDQQDF